MAEVCRAAALTMEAHGLGNRTEQLRNVADQLAAAPPPPAEQASGEHVDVLIVMRAGKPMLTPREQNALDHAIAALSQRPVAGGGE